MKKRPPTNDLNLVLFEPDSGWLPPTQFPNLSSAKKICVDLETKDPLLKTKGSGCYRKDGFPVGIALASDTGYKGYFPIAHFSGGNMNKENVVGYFTDLLKRTDLEVIGANLKYDLEWLKFMGIEAKGKLRDVQLAEPLIDEESPTGYSLDALSLKYLGIKKDETLLREAAAAYGIDPKTELWKLHSRYVGPYAEGDAYCTLHVHDKQSVVLSRDGLGPIYELECSLIEILVKMRHHGVRIDLEKAAQYSTEWRIKEEQLLLAIRREFGHNLDIWSSQSLARYCDEHGIYYPRTEKGNPSFDKIFLSHCESPFLQKVKEVRSLNRLRSTYVDELVFGNQIDGRIHCEFTQMVREDGGARTGRFSSKNPNLQQIPSRDKQLAPKIRSLFLPDGDQLWAKLDYSQQEPRVLTHFGYITKLRGASEVRDAYLADKTTDFYTLVSRTSGLERKPAKDLTLGICYGEGIDKISRDLGVSVEDAKRIKEKFQQANPFIQQLSEMAMNRAKSKGLVKTLLGRHRHFDLWEPNYYNHGQIACRKEEAEQRWKEIQRAYCYKALNAVIQGSSADMNKAALVLVYKELGKIPLLTVHDELDYSVDGEFEATSIQYRMENAVELTVPMYAELTLGKHWK